MAHAGQPVQESREYVTCLDALKQGRALTWLAATGEKQGVKVKINAQSTWNGGPMLRTELLPQTTNSLTGHLFFHVSLQIPTVNPPGMNYVAAAVKKYR